MKNFNKSLKIGMLILSLLTFPSCNLLEALHQSNPDYNHPVIFSDAWYQKREEQKKE